MAAERPKRANAGSKIGSLIDKELKDDFYSTAYGGFEEESNDEQYESECSEEDEVDSDFDVDESTWGPEDDAEEKLQKELKAQKKKKTWIKPYKEQSSSAKPPPKKPRTQSGISSSVVTSSAPPCSSVTVMTEQASRNFRKSTQEISRGFRLRFEEEQLMRKRKRKVNPRGRDRKLTQEELLEEAKWTEIENLASLEAYTRMEEERKKVKLKKKPWTGPVVRYLSLTMPVVTENERLPGSGEGQGGEMRSPEMLPSSLVLAGTSETKEVRFSESINKEASSSQSVMLSVAESTASPTPMDTSVSNAAADSPAVLDPLPHLPSGTNPEERGQEVTGAIPPSSLLVPSQTSQRGHLTHETQMPLQAEPLAQAQQTQFSPQAPLAQPLPQDGSNQSVPQAHNTSKQENRKQSRNFLIFTDTNKYPTEYFPGVRLPKPKQRRLCPVTRLPAKYIDPLTRTPYATPFAFKVIRTRYVKEAEQKCEQRLQQLSSWLEEKKKKKKLVAA